MADRDPRAALAALIHERGADCAALSRLIGRNPSYVQQFIQRGSPKRLAEQDRAVLARFFGVAETMLGGPERPAAVRALHEPPRYAAAASAGPGGVARDRPAPSGLGFSEAWLRALRPAGGVERLSVIEVIGTSMEPTLSPGDEILVDTGDTMRRDGIFVLRAGDDLLVKRLVRVGGRFAVRSDNPEAPPVDHPAEAFTVIGRVLWAGRRLR